MSKFLSKPLLGTLLDGRYKVVEVLSVSFESSTYLAEDTHQTDRPKCFVKQLDLANIEPSSWPAAWRLFASFAQTLKKLDVYDQIPSVLAYFEENRAFYLVSEFIEGQPLSAELATGQPWPEAKVVQLLQEVLGILGFVHSAGVIHGSISPDNIIRRQKDGKFVLINFGSEKQLLGACRPGANFSADPEIDCPERAKHSRLDLSALAPDASPLRNNDLHTLGKIGICALIGRNPEELGTDFDWPNWKLQLPMAIGDHLATVLDRMVRSHLKDSSKNSCETSFSGQKEALLQPVSFLKQTPDSRPCQQPVLSHNAVADEAVSPAISPRLPIGRLNPPSQQSEFSEDSAKSMEHSPSAIANYTQPRADAETPPLDEAESTEPLRETSSENQSAIADSSLETPNNKTHSKRSFSTSRLLVLGGLGLGMTANVVAILFGLTTLLEASQIDPGLDIFAQATEYYQQGDYNQAVSLAKTVPNYSAVFYEAHAALSQWEQEWNEANSRSQQVEVAFKESRWLDVFKEASQLPENSFWQKKVEKFVLQAAPKIEGTVRQSLQTAQEQVNRGDFAAALKVLYTIPKGVPNYESVQAKITEYKEKQHVKLEAKAYQLLEVAAKKAAQKDFHGAVKLIKQIPKGTTVYAKAQAHLVEYSQKRRIKADQLLQQANGRAANSDYTGAISLLKQIPKGTPAYITAQSKLVEYSNKLRSPANGGSRVSATPAANTRIKPSAYRRTRAAIPTQDVAAASASTDTSRTPQGLNPGDFFQEIGDISMVLPG